MRHEFTNAAAANSAPHPTTFNLAQPIRLDATLMVER
jgi:hypothetical protein